MSIRATISSPCIGVCKIDSASVCTGCHRTIEEISQWMRATADQKQKIVIAARQRRHSAMEPTDKVG